MIKILAIIFYSIHHEILRLKVSHWKRVACLEVDSEELR